MSKRDDLLRAIGAIHAAGLDAALWPQALEAIAALCGGVGTTLEMFDKVRQQHTLFKAAGIPMTMERAYVEYWAPRSPRVRHGQHLKAGEVGWDYQILDEAAMNRDDFYSELLPTTDFRYFVSGTLANSKSEYAVAAVQRTPRQGHVGAAEIATMQMLIPHLQQALDVAMRFKSAADAVQTFEDALNWLNDGAALVQMSGHVNFCNETFRRICDDADGLAIEHGAMVFAAADARANYGAALAALKRLAAGEAIAAPIADFTAARPSGAPAYVVSLRPLLREQARGADATVIAFVRDPLARNAAAMRLLREMFGLTMAEAGLAHALQLGLSPTSYARENAISPNTVYTHLRRVKEKIGCTRTADLTRKLNELQVRLRID